MGLPPTPLELLQEQAEDKAAFCLATGVQPSEYDALTQVEINAFIEAVKKQNRRRR